MLENGSKKLNKYIISGINGNVGKLLAQYFEGYDTFDNSSKSSSTNIFIHLAAKSYGEYEEIVESNINYLIKAIKFCERNGIKNFIFFSAFSISNKDDFYSSSKLFGEQILRESRLNVLILRLPMILTEDSTHGILNRITTKLENNHDIDLYSSEQKFNNFVCVDDIADFIKSYSFKKKNETINMASKGDNSLYEVVYFIKEILQSKSIIQNHNSQNSGNCVDITKLTSEYAFYPRDTREILSNWISIRKIQ